MTALETLKSLIKEFEEVQTRHEGLGAGATEPDGVFQVCLKRAFKGRDQKVPDTADGWQLYSSEKGADVAAGELAAVTRKCVEFVRGMGDAPHREVKEVEKYLKDYCWRVSW
jgi:hypothetical protein